MKRKLVTVDAETLLSTPMSKTMFIVDGLIPQGVNVLSGAAKIGKKLADAVAWLAGITGTSRLGNPDHALRCAVSLFRRYAQDESKTGFSI